MESEFRFLSILDTKSIPNFRLSLHLDSIETRLKHDNTYEEGALSFLITSSIFMHELPGTRP